MNGERAETKGARLALLWQRLVAPSSALTDVRDRRRAELLASLLVVFIPVGLASGLVQLFLVPGFASTFALMLGAIGLLGGAYAASRSPHYRVGGAMAAVAPMVASTASGLFRPSDPVWWAFVTIGVILATVFLPVRWAALAGAVGLALVAAVFTFRPGGDPTMALPALAFGIVVTPLILIGAHHRDRTELERERAIRGLEESRRLEIVGRLASSIAHDFNNLLTAVRGNADLLDARGTGSEEIAEIRRAVDRGATMAKQLLAYARRQTLEPVIVELDGVIVRLGQLLKRMAGDAVELVLDTGADHATVRADVSQLERVIVNLIVNAKDAMPGAGRITVRTRAVTSAGGEVAKGSWVALTVEDTGAGMTSEVLAQAFEPFFSTKGEGGTGLGLSMVQGVVAQSGGHVTVTSAPGAGTRFVIYLPRIGAITSVAG